MRASSIKLVHILTILILLVLPACTSQPQAPLPVESEPGITEIVPIAYHTVGEGPSVPALVNCTPLTRGRAVIPPVDVEELEGQGALDADHEDPVSPQETHEVQIPFELAPAPGERNELPPTGVSGEPIADEDSVENDLDASDTADTTSLQAPATVDPLKLTIWSEITGLGGKQMYDLYTRMWENKDGWWWQVFGEDGYSVWDFLSTFSYYEASGYISWAEVMAEAGVRWYFATGSFYGTPGSIEAVLNWWGAFSESTADVYFAGPNYVPTLPWRATLEEIEGMRVVGDSFEDPPEEWKLGFDAERPFGWGNMYICYSDKDLLDERRMLLLSQSNALFIYFGMGDRAFVIPSGCAWATGYNLWYDNYCSPVKDYTFARAD